MNKKIILGISLSFILVISIVTPIVIFRKNKGLKEHEPIVIWSDNDFNEYNFPGKGTINDPYLIQNFNITTTKSKGIEIFDTSKHFVIKNCFVKASYAGIYISNAGNDTVTVMNNTCSNSGLGIFIRNAPYSYLIDNICSHNFREDGIKVIESKGTIIESNTCEFNKGNERDDFGKGISVVRSPNSNITKNICRNNEGKGISITLSYDSSIQENIIIDNNKHGIYIDNSRNCSLSDNVLSHNILSFRFDGLDNILTLEYYKSFRLENNSLDDSPINLYTDLINETFTSSFDSQMIFVNCVNLTITNFVNSNLKDIIFFYCKNLVVSNSKFSNHYFDGLTIVESDFSKILNNICINNYRGIEIYSSSYLTIQNNNCSYNEIIGISIFGTYDSTFSNNVCSNNGFYGGLSIQVASQSTIFNNSLSNNIGLGVGCVYIQDIVIVNNTITDNLDSGVFIAAHEFLVAFNIIQRNERGIAFGGGVEYNYANRTIHHNLIEENYEYGIRNIGTNNITVYQNSFINNNLGGISQAYDEGLGNYWYEPNLLVGNYWSNWVSGNYLIDGTVGYYDLYPLSVRPV